MGDKSSNDIITTNKPTSESSEMGAKDEASTIEEKKDTIEPSNLIGKEGKTGETVTLSATKEKNTNFGKREVSESIQEEKYAGATEANIEGVNDRASTETKIKIEESVVSDVPMKEDQEDTPSIIE